MGSGAGLTIDDSSRGAFNKSGLNSNTLGDMSKSGGTRQSHTTGVYDGEDIFDRDETSQME